MLYSVNETNKEYASCVNNTAFHYAASTGALYYKNDGQSGERCGKTTLTLTAAYADNSALKDELTLTFQWADIEEARRSLKLTAETRVAASKASKESCATLINELKKGLESTRTNVLNVKLAVEKIDFYTPASNGDGSSTSCGCNPHRIVYVRFMDGTVMYYDENGASPWPLVDF